MRYLLFCYFICIANFSLAQPQKEIKAQIDKLSGYIKKNDIISFAKNAAYDGDDQKKQFKDVYNPDNPSELSYAEDMMERMKTVLDECKSKRFHSFTQHKAKIEGLVYTYIYACGISEKVYLSFVKIKGIYALAHAKAK
jgi:adenine-specific DNA methylase